MAQTPGTLYWPDWLSLVVALVALAQPWLFALWRRWFRKPAIEIYETATIEVGYGSLGPTLALAGTLAALNQAAFVRSARAIVTRTRDSARHILNWRAFRPNTVDLAGGGNSVLEIASGFMVSPDAPHGYNIFFSSDASMAEHRPEVARLSEQWMQFVVANLQEHLDEHSHPFAVLAREPAVAEELFDRFRTTPEAMSFWQRCSDGFFWQPGRYDLELEVQCSRPATGFRKRWSFQVSERDARSLRANSMAALREPCGLQVFYSCAYPEYEQASPR